MTKKRNSTLQWYEVLHTNRTIDSLPSPGQIGRTNSKSSNLKGYGDHRDEAIVSRDLCKNGKRHQQLFCPPTKTVDFDLILSYFSDFYKKHNWGTRRGKCSCSKALLLVFVSKKKDFCKKNIISTQSVLENNRKKPFSNFKLGVNISCGKIRRHDIRVLLAKWRNRFVLLLPRASRQQPQHRFGRSQSDKCFQRTDETNWL